jgi:hypothetical protein
MLIDNHFKSGKKNCVFSRAFFKYSPTFFKFSRAFYFFRGFFNFPALFQNFPAHFIFIFPALFIFIFPALFIFIFPALFLKKEDEFNHIRQRKSGPSVFNARHSLASKKRKFRFRAQPIPGKGRYSRVWKSLFNEF